MAWRFWRGGLLVAVSVFSFSALALWILPNTQQRTLGASEKPISTRLTAQTGPPVPAAPKPKSKPESTHHSESPPVSLSADATKSGGINVQQTTTGNHSPIVNSPITINPELNPNAPIVNYDFNGVRHEQIGSRFNAIAGDELGQFQKMSELEKAGSWSDLKSVAEAQIEKTPIWLTPYLFAGEACVQLGDKQRGLRYFEIAKQKSGGNSVWFKPAQAWIDRLSSD
jgi:hypothetical protein